MELPLILSGNIILNSKKEIYLLWRKDRKHLETPGGKVEKNENNGFFNPTTEELRATAERELLEEVKGIKIKSMEYFGKSTFTAPKHRLVVANKFLTKITGKPKPNEPIFDPAKSGWYKIEDLDNLSLSADFPRFLKKLKEM